MRSPKWCAIAGLAPRISTPIIASMSAAGSNADALMYAHLYIGLYLEAEGDARKSLQHIQLAAVKYAAGHYMGDVARLHYKLRR